MRRRVVTTGAVLAATVAAVAIGADQRAGGATRAVGEPSRGAAVFQDHQCWSCHALDAAGSSGKSGPDLDRWLRPHAAQLRLTPEALAAARIAYGGRGMPAYVRELDADQLADVVAFVVGRRVTLPDSPGSPAPPTPVPPPETRAPATTVARWVAAKRLRGSAARGARVFAREGCLSCHRYLGSGRSRFGGQDLSKRGSVARSVAGYARYVADPARAGNDLMPGYADLGAANLRALGAFLGASRRSQG